MPGSATGRSRENPTSTRVSRSFFTRHTLLKTSAKIGAIRCRIAHLHHEVSGVPAPSGPEGFILLSSKLLLGSKPCAVQRCRAVELPLCGLFELCRVDLVDRSDSLTAHCLDVLAVVEARDQRVPDLGIVENLVDVPASVLAPEGEIDG